MEEFQVDTMLKTWGFVLQAMRSGAMKCKKAKVAGNFAGPLLWMENFVKTAGNANITLRKELKFSSRYFTFGSGINLEPCGNTAGFCMGSPCPPYYTFPGGHGSGFKKNVPQAPVPIGYRHPQENYSRIRSDRCIDKS